MTPDILPTVTSVTSVTRTLYPNENGMIVKEKREEGRRGKKVYITCLQVSSYTSYSLASKEFRH